MLLTTGKWHKCTSVNDTNAHLCAFVSLTSGQWHECTPVNDTNAHLHSCHWPLCIRPLCIRVIDSCILSWHTLQHSFFNFALALWDFEFKIPSPTWYWTQILPPKEKGQNTCNMHKKVHGGKMNCKKREVLKYHSRPEPKRDKIIIQIVFQHI